MAYGAILNQKPQKKMLPEIIITPLDDSISFVFIISPTGERWEVFPNSQGVYISQLKTFGVYQVEISTLPTEPETVFEVNVDTCKQYNYVFPQPSGALNDNSWIAIRYASDNDLGESLWSVGDAKQITLDGNVGTVNCNGLQPWVYILGFNHNAELEGNNRIHFGCFRNGENYTSTNSIALVDSRYGQTTTSVSYYTMNTTSTNEGGWGSSYMRTDILNSNTNSPTSANIDTFLHSLPTELKNVMKKCTKYSDNTGGKNNTESGITPLDEWVWLLSVTEVGKTNSANQYEQNYQKQYDYYILGNSIEKYNYNSLSSNISWWSRSADINTFGSFCFCDGGTRQAYYSYGLAPAFCV